MAWNEEAAIVQLCWGERWGIGFPTLGLIDEYLVDYEEYVGIGSGAFSYLRGDIYLATFSLRQYEREISAGRMPIALGNASSGLRNRMRFRFLIGLFGLRLDICPFTIGTVATIFSGMCHQLTDRAADVTLKEGRERSLAIREPPFLRVPLENMLGLARAGGTSRTAVT